MPTKCRNERKDMATKGMKIFQILATLVGILFLTGCRTVRVVEKQETVRVDSVVMYDTVYSEHHTVEYDTTYVYDSYKETYAIGGIDTVLRVRVDTVRVSTINYIYKERLAETTDSAVSAKVNSQKAATTDVRTVEKVVEKDVPMWKKVCVVLGVIVVAMIFYVAGSWGGKRQKVQPPSSAAE